MNTRTNRGFTLLEVMIALIIFSIGLLGLAGMQAISLENNRVAYKRTIATQLAYDMADRIRNNPNGSYAYSGTTPLTQPSPVCISTTASACTSANMASWDLYEWDQAIRDKKNTTLVNPRGIITSTTEGYSISIGWDESSQGLDPTTYDCSNPATGLECVTITVEL